MKITLNDIMESLDAGNDEAAQAGLHEWLVDRSKDVHARLTGKVLESEEVDEGEEEDKVEEEVNESTNAVSENSFREEGTFVLKIVYPQGVYDDEIDDRLLDIISRFDDVEDDDNGNTNIFFDEATAETFHSVVAAVSDLDGVQVELLDPDTMQAVSSHPAASDASRVGTESHQPTFEELVAELSESFQGLETVSDKLQNVEGAQVGEEGKVPVNTKPTLPSKKGDKRVGGEPVEIKGKGHTGHALETAPKVKDAPVKHHVQNSKDDPKKVTAPKGALLNKREGSENTQSPISGKGAKGLKK